MKTSYLLITILMGFLGFLSPNFVNAQDVPVYRYYNPTADRHFFTTNPDRDKDILDTGYTIFEGAAWFAPSTGIPVERWFNTKTGIFFYTTDSKHERLPRDLWKFQMVDFHARPRGDGDYVGRYYNKSMDKNFWTLNYDNDNVKPEHGYQEKPGSGFYMSRRGPAVGPVVYKVGTPGHKNFLSVGSSCNRIDGNGWYVCGEVYIRYDGTISSSLRIESTNDFRGFTGAMEITFYDMYLKPIHKITTPRYGVNANKHRTENWTYKMKHSDILQDVMYVSTRGIRTSKGWGPTIEFLTELGKKYLEKKGKQSK